VQAPYGTWLSPVTGQTVAADRGWGYGHVTPAGDAVYWSEARPLEDGRTAIVRRSGGAPQDAIPSSFDARTRVHEYGGAAFAVHGDTLFFCHDSDQRVYRLDPGGEPRPLTGPGARHADLRVTPDGALVLCVRERGRTNELAAVPAGGGEARTIASGHDFFAAPRVSPDGTRLAWLTWDHPRMPWDGSELWVADLRADGALSGARRIAGGPDEAVLAPEWSPAGVLHYSSDRTGWWNLYRERGEAVAPVEAEIGGPLWFLGASWYGFLDDGRIVLTYSRDGQDNVAVVEDGALRTLATGLTAILDFTSDGRRALLVGATPWSSPSVLAVDPDTGAVETLSEALPDQMDPAYVSVPRPLEYESAGGARAHALVFAPSNPDYEAPAGERPPLVVRVHGGPTAHVRPVLNLEVQFFTSRGFAVVEVNYGGSTGYGRAYRERLRGRWGVVDTEDAVHAARALAEAGEADGARMAISGGSAGGWTVLCALAFHDVFAAGADYYGICDLTGFDEDTHKFESRYADWLAGPQDGWAERSPITYADRIRAPVIVLQGAEDPVVPPSQSERIVAALGRNRVPHAYLVFEGEQHGFRRAGSLQRAVEAELSFYAQVLGFEPAGAPVPVAITPAPATAESAAST
jgi:dipeptidyl aminopeptidase/acylaminoacyl peptidase